MSPHSAAGVPGGGGGGSDVGAGTGARTVADARAARLHSPMTRGWPA